MLAGCLTAEASPTDVPLHHWSYEVIDRLAAMGLCHGAGLGIRPFSREWLASRISEALKAVEENDVGISPDQALQIEEDLLRLSYEFAPELKALGVSVGDEQEKRERGQPFRWRAFLFQTGLVSEKIITDFDQDSNTSLLENSGGFRLRDGFNTRWHFPTWLSVGDWLGLTLDPSLRGQKEDQGDLDVEEASAKLVYRNLEVKGGKLAFWWGPGYHGDFAFTNNTRPLPALSLRTRHSVRLPWLLKSLGEWQAELVGARLEEKRSGPANPLLTGLRLEGSPHRRFIIGLSQAVLFGGEGEKEEISDFFGAMDITGGGGEHERADHLFTADIRCLVPEVARWIKLGAGLEAYVELFAEDTQGFYVPDLVSYLGGFLIADIFSVPGFDFRFEWAKTHRQAYDHFVYQSGYRFKNEFLGHAIGPDAEDFFLRLSRRFFFMDKPFSAGIQFDRERRGISGKALPFGDPALTKNEIQVDLVHEFSKRLETTLAYQFEDIDNFQGSTGVEARNHIVSLQTMFRF